MGILKGLERGCKMKTKVEIGWLLVVAVVFLFFGYFWARDVYRKSDVSALVDTSSDPSLEQVRTLRWGNDLD